MRMPQEQSGADSIALRQVIVLQTGEDVTAQVSLKLYPLLHDQEPWQDTGELDLS
jgi:hypothetical protein